MPPPVQLVSIATAVPPFRFEQRDVAAAAYQGFASRFDDFERWVWALQSRSAGTWMAPKESCSVRVAPMAWDHLPGPAAEEVVKRRSCSFRNLMVTRRASMLPPLPRNAAA
jgi:hypothetical protein